MKLKYFTLLLIVIVSCNQKEAKGKSKQVVEKEKNYTKIELNTFLDSVASLPLKPLIEHTNHYSDSIFQSIKPLNETITIRDWKYLHLAEKQDWYLDLDEFYSNNHFVFF